MTIPPFKNLGLDQELLTAIHDLGFEQPSPIQAMTIPVALAGQDIVGLSQTGSGKTAAFTIPTLQKIDLNQDHPQVLILCPTRELSIQVCEEVHRLGHNLDNLKAIPVYGGAPIGRQIRLFKQGVHLVVGTPGRLLDHLRRGTFDPTHIRIAILDEADRMLDMGFRDEINEILNQLPKKRQMLFFSATMNRGVKTLIEHFSNKPKEINIKQKSLTVDSVIQQYYEVRNRSKIEVLTRLLDMEAPRLAIVFCNTKNGVDMCDEALKRRGYSVDRLHGDISQQNRERVLQRFRDGTVEILVATDVAARGLDVDNIDMVFNYDLPQDPEDYVHRIGRTGRAGRSGYAISFVYGKEIYRLQTIGKYTRQSIKRSKIPSQETVEGRKTNKFFETLRHRLETQDFHDNQDYIDRLLDQGHTATDIASALFTLLRENQGYNNSSTAITEDLESDSFSTSSRERKQKKLSKTKSRLAGKKGNAENRSRSQQKSTRDINKAHSFEEQEIKEIKKRKKNQDHNRSRNRKKPSAPKRNSEKPKTKPRKPKQNLRQKNSSPNKRRKRKK